jgi:hypothetical protein
MRRSDGWQCPDFRSSPPRFRHRGKLLAGKDESANDTGVKTSILAQQKSVLLQRRLPATNNQGIIFMIITLRRVSALFVTAAVTMATSAFAQGPSEAQRAAVKAQCRSDYMAHCSSVTPGGKEALECLAQHMSSLSGGCQAAVKAVQAAVEPKEEPKQETKEEAKPEAKPEAAPATQAAKPAAEGVPKAAATAPAKKPSSAQIAAVKSNCRSDYMKACAGVPTGGAAALQCLEENEAKLSPSCKKAVAAASGGGGGAAPATANAAPEAPAAGGTPATAPAAPRLVLRPMRPVEVLAVMRSACGADVRTLCAGVPPGGGRIISCLVEQSASLSPACREVLGQFATR